MNFDFTKWEKLIANIPLKDLWVPHEVVDQFTYRSSYIVYIEELDGENK